MRSGDLLDLRLQSRSKDLKLERCNEGMNGQNRDGRNNSVNEAQSRGSGGNGGGGGYCGGSGYGDSGADMRRDSSMEYKGLTPEEMLRLPTGPKEQYTEEMQYGRLGGGFQSYGRSGPPPNRSRWGWFVGR